MIELTSVPAPADPRSASLRRVGAKAVLVGPPSAPPLPFEVADSKTLVPPLLAGTVSRTALVNRLRAAGAFPLVLVVAPAGYGKTTLLSQWAARDVRPFAWVSVDDGDDDPVSLLRLVAAALDRIEPLPQSALEPLAPERRPAPAKALQRLGASIAARRSPFVLVVDGADALTHDDDLGRRNAHRAHPDRVDDRALRSGRARPAGGRAAGRRAAARARVVRARPQQARGRDAAARRHAGARGRRDQRAGGAHRRLGGRPLPDMRSPRAQRATRATRGTSSRSPAPTATSPTTSARSTSRGSSPTG